jgi:hypothetical protein
LSEAIVRSTIQRFGKILKFFSVSDRLTQRPLVLTASEQRARFGQKTR